MSGNRAGAPGEDAHIRGLINQHMADLDAEEAWQERVREEAAYLQHEKPYLEADEAWKQAEERLRNKDQQERELYWDSVAYERGMG